MLVMRVSIARGLVVCVVSWLCISALALGKKAGTTRKLQPAFAFQYKKLGPNRRVVDASRQSSIIKKSTKSKALSINSPYASDDASDVDSYDTPRFENNGDLPRGSWIDNARNISTSISPDGPILHADMLCEGGKYATTIHVDMLYVPSIEYRWEYNTVDQKSPTCRFNWDDNQGILKTWQIKNLSEKKQWFNPVSNPQYMYKIAPPLRFPELLPFNTLEYSKLFRSNRQIVQVLYPKKVLALSLFAPSADVGSWRQSFESMDKEGQQKKHRYLTDLFNNLDDLFRDSHEDYTVNMYLSDNLSFLERKLLSYRNVNIFYMGRSEAPNPGAMWRFLEISNKHADFVHVRDTDQKWSAKEFTEREAAMVKYNKSFAMEFFRGDGWRENRAAIWRDVIAGGEFSLRPKALGIDNIGQLMSGYVGIAESRRNTKNPYGFHDHDPVNYWNHPSLYKGNTLGFGKTWPAYSFDQGFLKYVVYPYLAENDKLMMMSYGRRDNCRMVEGVECSR